MPVAVESSLVSWYRAFVRSSRILIFISCLFILDVSTPLKQCYDEKHYKHKHIFRLIDMKGIGRRYKKEIPDQGTQCCRQQNWSCTKKNASVETTNNNAKETT